LTRIGEEKREKKGGAIGCFGKMRKKWGLNRISLHTKGVKKAYREGNHWANSVLGGIDLVPRVKYILGTTEVLYVKLRVWLVTRELFKTWTSGVRTGGKNYFWRKPYSM